MFYLNFKKNFLGLILVFNITCFAAINFTNVGDQTNTRWIRNVHGAGFYDYNNDGYDDIFVVHNDGGASPIGYKEHLLLQNQNGTSFTKVVSGISGIESYSGASSQGLCAGDFDNNGTIDMVIAYGIGPNTYRDLLIKNNGDGTFVNQENPYNIGIGSRNRGRTNTFFDYNNDGRLDYFCAGDTEDSRQGNALYKNINDTTFLDVTWSAGLYHSRSSDDIYGFTLGDYDNDNDIDVYFGNRTTGSKYFQNQGNGTFANRTAESGLPDFYKVYGTISLDYNNDGYLDIFLRREAGYNCRLYRNDGDGTFTDVSSSAGLNVSINKPGYGGGLSVADFDNDGWVDILALTEIGVTTHLFKNNGDGTFTDVGSSAGVRNSCQHNWVAPLADYNHDGYVDIFMGSVDSGLIWPFPEFKTYLLRNNGGTNKWLHVKLDGVESNKLGIGSRVVIYSNGALQMRQVYGGDSYKTDSFPVEFGLGSVTKVDSLVVYWPSGVVQRMYDVNCNQMLTITEDARERFAVSGQIKYFSNSQPIENIDLKINGESEYTTTSNGLFSFNLIAEQDYTILPENPTTAQPLGTVTMYDAFLVAQHATGSNTLSGNYANAADVDQNDEVTSFDAANIARYSVGLDQAGDGETGSWIFDSPSMTFNNLSSNQADQDFLGVVLGDADGSWPGSQSLAKINRTNRLVENYEIVGDTLLINLENNVCAELFSFDAVLEYNANDVEFLSVKPSHDTQDFHYFVNNSKDLRLGAFSTESAKLHSELLTVKFKIKNPDNILINMPVFRLNNETVEQSTLLVNGPDITLPNGHFVVNGNYPNPFNNNTVIQFTLPELGLVNAAVYNVNGKLVKTLVNQTYEKGVHNIRWNGTTDNGHSASSGVYFVWVKFNDEYRSLQVLLQK